MALMYKSMTPIAILLADLTTAARRKGWSDAEWSRRSGVPKETLCRLRSRTTCDFATLDALAGSAGVKLEVSEAKSAASPDGLWPSKVNRALEAQLVQLAATRSTQPDEWRQFGPAFFLAGLAVMLASVGGFDRTKFLELAEALHPGAAEPRVFARWLAETPLPPSRFLPMLREEHRRAA